MHFGEFPTPLSVRLSKKYISSGFIFPSADQMTHLHQLEKLLLNFPTVLDCCIGVEVKRRQDVKFDVCSDAGEEAAATCILSERASHHLDTYLTLRKVDQ